ncbi:MAG: Coenzyme F420 hydrogenase/dehydrogenase, beta subunit C-terminal domain, partial [Dehalococcoidia bacterium]|nr:Coenzyme F420 hydrogenase/dehydrogenase, beta subunit C-terminal domain [Dehalococcoidia bacterium]
WAKFKEWNTVIVRTQAGADIIQRAKEKGAIEVQPLPEESLALEKKASLDKKKRAVKNIVAKSGDRQNLLYFGIPRTLVTKLSS